MRRDSADERAGACRPPIVSHDVGDLDGSE